MYCSNCGQDQPEIKINDKLYCANCGLPLSPTQQEPIEDEAKEGEEESQNDLSQAFGAMKTAIEKSGSGFYRSGDTRIIPRKVIKPLGEKQEKQPTATREEILQESTSNTASHTDFKVDKPVQSGIEADLDLGKSIKPAPLQVARPPAIEPEEETQEIAPELPPEEKKPIESYENKELEKNFLAALEKKEEGTDLNLEPNAEETSNLIEIDESKNDSISQELETTIVEETSPQKQPEVEIKKETPPKPEKVEKLADILEEPKVLKASEKAINELYKDRGQRDITHRIKEIDKLGASSRLIDILEENETKEAFEGKRNEVKKMGSAFGRLIDILNQPVPSPKPVKKYDKNPIIMAADELNAQKEITSPLDEPEIIAPIKQSGTVEEKPKNKKEKKLNKNKDKETWPIFAENPAMELETKLQENNQVNNKEEIQGDEKPSIEEDGDKAKIQERIEDILANEQESVSDKPEQPEKLEQEEPETVDLQEKPANTIKEETDQEIEETEPPKLSKHELESIQKEIHALGDKKGHTDDWPEEEVVRVEDEEKVTHAPIKEYLDDLLSKTTPEKPKKKQKRSKKEKGNFLKFFGIFLATLFLLAGIGGISVYLSSKNPAELVEINNISFTPKYPLYIPIGYERRGVKTENSALIATYKYLPRDTEEIILTEQEISDDFSLEEYANANSISFDLEDTAKARYYILDDKEITWLDNKLLFSLEKPEGLSLEELKKVAESIE